MQVGVFRSTLRTALDLESIQTPRCRRQISAEPAVLELENGVFTLVKQRGLPISLTRLFPYNPDMKGWDSYVRAGILIT